MILPLSAPDRFIIVIAITATFVILVVATHAFRHQQPANNGPTSYRALIHSPAAILSTDTANNHLPPPPTICSIEYSAASSRLRNADVKLHDRSVLALIDTAAEVSIVRPSVANELRQPFEAAHGRSYATTASGGLLFFTGATTTSLSIAGQSIQHRLLVPTTDDVPAQLIIGLDVLSSLAQPISFDFIDNCLSIAHVPIQLYEMPSTPRARNFVPPSSGQHPRVRFLIDQDYIPIPKAPPPRLTPPTDVTTTSASDDYVDALSFNYPRPSPSTKYASGRQEPSTAQPTLGSSSEPFFIFDAMINGIQTRAAFDNSFPACRCRLSFCLEARLQFSRWNNKISSNNYVSRSFGTAFGVITIGRITTDSRALLVTADHDLRAEVVFGAIFLQELYTTVSLDVALRTPTISLFTLLGQPRKPLPLLAADVELRNHRHHRRHPRSPFDDHPRDLKNSSTHRRSDRLSDKRARLHHEQSPTAE
ncbi:hypothetical protein AAVH_22644 [Aphelenchoides avenae]|nr:hypothetical protein AAVH_22644 [Aphelenchus avenae]